MCHPLSIKEGYCRELRVSEALTVCCCTDSSTSYFVPLQATGQNDEVRSVPSCGRVRVTLFHCFVECPRLRDCMIGGVLSCHSERSFSEVEESGWGKCHRTYKPNVSVAVTRFFGKLRMTVAVSVLPHSAVGGTH
jgi:hypothetical protein